MRSDLIARVVAVAFVAAPAGCLLDWDSLRPLDGGLDASDDVGNGDAASDVAPPDANDGGSDSSTCVLQLVVNELQTDGPLGPSDEFVELRNGASCGGSLSNWTLRYSSASGSAPNTLWTGQAGDIVGAAGDAGAYVLLAGYIFQTPDGGHVTGRISTDIYGALSKSGGGVGLFSPTQVLVDGVAYQTITTQTHPFIRPAAAADGGASTPAPNAPSNKSIARTPDGQNTNTNATDFQVATPTPGVSN